MSGCEIKDCQGEATWLFPRFVVRDLCRVAVCDTCNQKLLKAIGKRLTAMCGGSEELTDRNRYQRYGYCTI